MGDILATEVLPKSGRAVSDDALVHDGVVIEYTVVRSSRRRRTLSLSLDAEGRAKVAVPTRTSHAQIQAFVARCAPWIVRKRAAIAAAPPPPRLVSGASLLYLGRDVVLDVVEAPGVRARVLLDGDGLTVALPATLDGEAREAAARLALTHWYRERAGERLVEETARWAGVMGVEPTDVRVRDQRRRWGSCGSDGTIRFNFRLVMAPQEVIDYVVVHELAHLRVPNHSRAFWDEVARFIPDHTARRARLNQLSSRMAM